MRSFISVALLMLAPALAVPMFDRDPASIHVPTSYQQDSTPLPASTIVDTLQSQPQPSEDACDAVCGIQHFDAASGISERDALCSDIGLSTTLKCALCIDNTWTESTWEDSALAEYERIVEACKSPSQKVFGSQDYEREI